MPWRVIAIAYGVIGLTIAIWTRCGPVLVINVTPSEPIGVYRAIARPRNAYRRGMLVLFPVPRTVERLVLERGWLKPGVPLLKELAGLAGDQVCVLSGRLQINGRTVGPVFDEDRTGQPLPQLRGCFAVPAGYFFAASSYLDQSFDGRYFGALPLAMVTAEARPLWTF
jgi:conjugative transfer signal peptidase TraF